MRYRRLGSSDLEVSEISLGSWITFSGEVERATAEQCTRAAFDAGVNFFDTANVYGRGAAEVVWGEILSQLPREQYILATKVYFPMSDSDFGLSRAQIHKQIDASLARLQTEYVDLYQCHRYDVETPIEETMEALTEVVRAGKARWIGFSEWTNEQIEAALAVPDTAGFVSSQPQYNAIWRAPEAELFELCRRERIGNIVWSPLAQGVLTGKYAPGAAPPQGSRAAAPETAAFVERYLAEDVLRAVAQLRPIADEAGLTMVQLALGWVLRREEVSSAIVGASRPEQVAANVAASGIQLSADVIAAMDDALAGVAQHGPRLAPFAQAGVKRR
jgi:aryl-alcohol dehydrogenase-like predicted oxidoreductase